MRYPYELITGSGLGLSYSSLNQIGSLLPSRAFGQAGLQLHANLANGNVIIKDHVVKVAEMNGPLEFGYIYNSQADSPANVWRLNIAKRFSQLPSITRPLGETATLIEADGHETSYILDPTHNYYFAPGLKSGTPYLYFDYTNDQWTWYDAGTGITEYYDTQGNLKIRCDAAGRKTQFYYDDNNQLLTIVGPTGNGYVIDKQGQDTGIYFVEDALLLQEFIENKNFIESDSTLLLQQYHFDDLGRLETTSIPDANGDMPAMYTINYSYIGNTNCIQNITQTDGTNYLLGYDTTAPGILPKINQLSSGAAGKSSTTRIDYSNPSVVKVTDGFRINTLVTLDDQSRITELSQEQGYSTAAGALDITQYSYAEHGQLQNITSPDNSQETFTYSDNPDLENPYPLGLLIQHTKPNGQKTNYQYEMGEDRPQLSGRVQVMDDKSAAVARFVYDDNFDNLGQQHSFKRFEISPIGTVTEYRPDNLGNPVSARTYLANIFDVSILQPSDTPSLKEMEDWVQEQNPQQISLSEFKYNNRGQIFQTKRYANIDVNGEGIEDGGMSLEQTSWDALGGWTERYVTQQQNVIEETKQVYDGLHRIIEVTDALGETTTTNYLDRQKQIQIIRPNGRQETKNYDTQGLLASELDTVTTAAGTQTRNTIYSRDVGGRLVMTQQPDTQKTYTFFDRQQRLGFTVSATGIVAQHQYDRVHRFHMTTQYANPINVSKLYPINPPPPGILPDANKLQELIPDIQDPDNDRVNYTFYDASGRIQYQVEAKESNTEFVITEFIYDNFDRKIGKTSYYTPLSADLLNQLKLAETINIPINPDKDQSWQYFYDNDNRLIAKIDQAGYVTQFLRDAAGRIQQKIVYGTPLTNRNAKKFSDFNLSPTSKDAITNYYYNARGQCVAEVSPEHYLTVRTFLACGAVEQKIRYATRITDPNWLNDPIEAPTPPPSSTEDQITTYQYDLLNREIEANGPANSGVSTQYDVMGHVVVKRTQDLMDITDIDPDYQRSKQTQYDGWEQISEEAPPNVAQLLTEIDGSNLTPEQKKTAKEQVWQNQSVRNTFDATGLKLSTTDPLGNITYFYYDYERRPIIIIAPTGAVIEKTISSFDETLITRGYTNRIAASVLPTLTGGFITPTFRQFLNSLQDNVDDEIIQDKFDLRGQVTQHVDAEGNITTKTYNAFKQCEQECQPITNQQSLTVVHEFEPRGLEIKTTQQASDGTTSITTRHFNNPSGKLTDLIDPRNGRYQTEYDLQDRVVEKIDPLGNSHTYTWDAFDRVETETNAFQQITVHSYDQQTRTHTISYPDTQKTTKNNVHDEVIASTTTANGNNLTENWTHEPDGQISSHSDQLGNTTTDTHDLMGRLRQHEDANQIKTSYDYNGAGQRTQQVQDIEGLALITDYQPDAFGNVAVTIDPMHVVHANTYDRCNRLTQTVVDPLNNDVGLNLVTQQTYNRQGAKTSVMRGDEKVADQFYTTYQYDGLNRSTGKIVDPTTSRTPNALNITVAQHLNAAGDAIAEIDANGNTTRNFYDVKGQKRFSVDPMGGVTEFNYDFEGNVQYKRIYTNGIDPKPLSDQTTLAQLQALVITDPTDTLTWYFYNAENYERFNVTVLAATADEKTPQGIVEETRYDTAMRKTQTITYNTSIDATNINTMSNAQLSTLMPTLSDPLNDHIRYFILDAKGQERFWIDVVNDIVGTQTNAKQEAGMPGVLTEQRFDSMGRVIAQIKYANPVTNAAELAALDDTKVLAAFSNADPLLDRATYYVYDSVGRPLFTVEPGATIDPDEGATGAVTYFRHDENGNLLQKCQFKQPIVIPADYSSLVSLLNTLKPNPAVDRITQFQYDNGNRLIQTIDTLQNVDTFVPDALGRTKAHVDRGSNTWQYDYDRANRATTEIAPATTLTQVQVGSDGRLSYTQTAQPTTVTKFTQYDNVGNTTSITEAYGTPQARTFNSTYNARNQLSGTQLNNVTVDDPTKSGSFSNRPENLTNINTQIVYNAKKYKICEKNEAGQWHFYVYDSRDKLTFEVDSLGGVTEYVLDVFGEPIQQVFYFNPLQIDLNRFIQIGISQEIILQNLQPDPENDRVILMDRNQLGDVVSVQKTTKENPIFYYIPGDTPVKDTACPVTNNQYNAFREWVAQSQLVDNKNQVWSQRTRWLNGQGKVLAECNPINAVTTYERSVFGEEVARNEFATPLNQTPAADMPVTTVEGLIRTDTKDRHFAAEFDQRGQKISDTRLGVTIQQLNPYVQNQPATWTTLQNQNLSRHYQYSATQQPIATTYENGSKEYTYYDARGFKIADTGVTRTTSQGQDITPLTYYGVNAFGQTELELGFFAGTSAADPQHLPVPLGADARDQYKLTAHDNRGLVTNQQKPEGYQNSNQVQTTGVTYTATKKVARQWNNLTNWQQIDNNNFTTQTFIDEKRFGYDGLDRAVRLDYYRDGNQIQGQSTQSFYNTFSDPIGEGPGDGTMPLYRKFDRVGNCWASNVENGVDTLFYYNLIPNQQTLRGQSATKSLDNVIYDAVEEPLSWSITDFEKNENTRDLGGRVLMKTEPECYTNDPSQPISIPLQVLVSAAGDITTLSWPIPQETNVTPQFTIWPTANAALKKSLPITMDNGRCFVDVSSLDTDEYHYQINYTMPMPNESHVKNHPIVQNAINQIVYVSSGNVQFDTSNTESSLSLVTIVQGINQLHLTGNTANLTGIQLWQDNHSIAQINLQPGQNIVDLSGYPSGAYSAVPVINNVVGSTQTLPFTIYTATPSRDPLAREIYCNNVSLSVNDTTGQLQWQLPADLLSYSVLAICTYVASDGSTQTEQFSIQPGTSLNGINQGTCSFKKSVTKIKQFTLSLQLDVNNVVPLLINANPLPSDLLHLCAGKNSKVANSVDNDSKFDDDDYLMVSSQLESAVTVTANFAAHDVIYVTPWSPSNVSSTVQYWDSSLDLKGTWKNLAVTGATASGFAIDVTGFPPGEYPFQMNGVQNCSFTVSEGGLVFSGEDNGKNGQILLHPNRQYQYDVWNNKTSEKDSLGNITTYSYTDQNRISSVVQPEVTVTNEDGSTEQAQPTIAYGYDTCSRKIFKIDPNNHVQGYYLDAAGQKVRHVLGDGTCAQTQVFDSFGRATTLIDASNNSTQQQYDHNNNIIKTTSPMGHAQYYGFNETDLRNSAKDADGNITRYNTDPMGNVSDRYLPMGQHTQMTYNHNHQPLGIFYSDGTSLTYERGYFNQPLTHTDLSGAKFTYIYDCKGQLTQQFSQGGNHGQYYAKVAHTVKMPEWYPVPYLTYYSYEEQQTPNQNLQYEYVLGRLVQVRDVAQGKTTNYIYDTEGRVIGRQIWNADGSLVRYMKAQVDAGGNEVWTSDNVMTVQTGFDRNNNRRNITSYLYQNSLDPVVNQTWNTIDAADRILVDGGVLNGNNIQIASGQGMEITYLNNLRNTETTQDENKKITDSLQFNPDGLLTSTQSSDGLKTQRGYDNADWQTGYSESGSSNNVNQQNNYNANGFETKETQNNIETTFGDSSPTGGFNDLGQAVKQTVHYNDEVGTWDELNVAYTNFESPQLSGLNGVRHNRYGTSGPNYSMVGYDANGTLNSRIHVAVPNMDPNNPATETVFFDTTPDGNILQQHHILPPGFFQGRIGVLKGLSPNYRDTYYFYSPGGQRIGSYQIYFDANLLKPILTYEANLLHARYGNHLFGGAELKELDSLAQSVPLQGRGFSLFPPSGRVALANAVQPVGMTNTQQGSAFLKNTLFSFVSLNPMSYALEPNNYASASYPPAGPTTYTVCAGDTFDSIAQKTLRDSRYASAIAIANGWTVSQPPPVGEILRIPPLISSYNGATTSQPYQAFVNTLLGNLYPVLKDPEPKDHDNFLVEAIGIVVAVVAMYAAPVIGQAVAINMMGLAAGSTAAAVTTAIATGVSGALIEAAGQGLVVGLGGQFSMASVIETGLSLGMGNYLFADAIKAGMSVEDIAKVMLDYGVINMTEQLTEMKLGLINQFSPEQVVRAMFTGIASLGVGVAAGSPALLGQGRSPVALSGIIEQNVANSFIDSTLGNMIIGTPPSMTQFAAEAIGSTVGYVGKPLGESLSSRIVALSGQTNIYQSSQNASAGTTTPTTNNTSSTSSSPSSSFSIGGVSSNSRDYTQEDNFSLQDYFSAQDAANMPLPSIALPGSLSVGALNSVGGSSATQSQVLQSNNRSSFWSKVTTAVNNFLFESDKSLVTAGIEQIGETARNDWLPKYQGLAQQYLKQGVAASTSMQSLDSSIKSLDDVETSISQKALAAESFNSYAYSSFFASSAKALGKTAPLVGPLIDTGQAIHDVSQAQPADKLWTGFRDYGSVGAGIVGGIVGGIVAAPLEFFAPVISTPAVAASAAVVGTAFSKTWETGVDLLHEEVIQRQLNNIRVTVR